VKIDGLSHNFSKNNDIDLSEQCEEHKHKVNNDLVINNFNESNVLNEGERINKQDKDDIREEVNKEYCIEDFENVANLNTNNIQSEEEMVQDSLYPKNEEIPGILRKEQIVNEEKLLQTSSDTKNDLNTNEELHYPILEDEIINQEHELNDENISNASEINEENKCPTPGYVEESECLTDAFELPHENKILHDSTSKSKTGFDLTNIGTIQDSICTKKTEEASNIHMSENVKRKIDELISLETKEKKTVDDFLFNKTLQIPVNVSEISYDSSEKSDDKTMQEINLLSQEMKHETDKFIEFFKEAKEQMLTSVNMNNIEGNVKSNEEKEKEESGSLQEEKSSRVKRVKIKAQANKKINAVKNESEIEKIVEIDDENRNEIDVLEKNKITKRKVKQFGKKSDEPVNKEVLNDGKINSKESKKAKSKVEKKKEVLENKNTLIKNSLTNINKKLSHTSVAEDKLSKKSLSTDSKKMPKKKRKKLTLPRKFK
ncbi:hypothetical protein H311_01761, partial [Anncaliia algerae PRA109]